MQQRIRYTKAAPQVYRAMLDFSQTLAKSPLKAELVDLVNYRASQINGCAYCLDMHSKDLRARGETEQRLYMLNAWREMPQLYTEREQAALAWTDAVTKLTDQAVPDAVYEEASKQFKDDELAWLTLAVVAINGWNRLNVAFHTPAGDYRSAVKQTAA